MSQSLYNSQCIPVIHNITKERYVFPYFGTAHYERPSQTDRFARVVACPATVVSGTQARGYPDNLTSDYWGPTLQYIHPRHCNPQVQGE